MKFYETPSSASRVISCRRTDGLDEANSHFPQFFESA